MWVVRGFIHKSDRVKERLNGCSEKSASNNRVDSMDKETDFKKVDMRVRRRVPVSKEWTTYISSNFSGALSLQKNALEKSFEGEMKGTCNKYYAYCDVVVMTRQYHP